MPSKFNPCYAAQKNFLSRQRKFSPQTVFFSVLQLATSTNCDGYHWALSKTWQAAGLKIEDTPSKSSLSEVRDKVSFKFFKDIYRQDLKRLEVGRKKFRGLFIYAVDGDQLDLPASKDIFDAGYRGYPCSKKRETHYPKMYTAHAFDVVNSTVSDFRYSPHQDETHLAREMVNDFEKNSLAIYDRLHCGYGTIDAHTQAGNYFLIRGRTTGRSTPRVIKDFLASNQRTTTVWWHAVRERRKEPAIRVRLVKVKNPRTREDLVLVTNLPKHLFSRKELAGLYQRRWEIESSFRDLTHTMKMSQWHSKKFNGILQEIFALLWIANAVKRQINSLNQCKSSSKFLARNYTKSNFKLCLNLVIEHLHLLLQHKTKELIKILDFWIRRTLEKRKHLSRFYPRVVRHRGREYKYANLVPRRDAT